MLCVALNGSQTIKNAHWFIVSIYILFLRKENRFEEYRKTWALLYYSS